MPDNRKVSKKVDKMKNQKTKPVEIKNTNYDSDKIPAKLVLGMLCLFLSIVHIVVAFRPSGAVPLFYRNLIMGLYGRVGFYLSLFLLPYMFWALVILRKGKPGMRCLSAIGVVGIFSIMMQFFTPETDYTGFLVAVKDLYQGGITGSSSGVICGGIGLLLENVLGDIIAFILLVLLAAVLLLRAMEITLTGLYKAIQARPRPEQEEDDTPPRDYAADLVNFLSNKPKLQLRRPVVEEDDDDYEYYDDEDDDVEPLPIPGSRFVKGLVSNLRDRKFFDLDDEEQDAPEEPSAPPVQEAKRNRLMRQMEQDTDTPVNKQKELPAPEKAAPKAQSTPVEEAPAPQKPSKKAKKEQEAAAEAVAQELDQAAAAVKPPYCFPPINLLKMPPRTGVNGTEEMKENSRRLNETLESFNIAAHIVNVTRGPSVTRYEVELDKGVKLSKLTNCADDIALSLGASGVRIAAVPGKISVVGIEVPNRAVTMVSLREVIDSNEFNNSKGLSTFAVGKDIGGSCIIGNIAKMPHMLIAGTTGSGKSVCMNSIIISLLYKASPEDVKLIMVDPKMVELANYNGIPHLMIPVVTDPKKAAGALQWAVTEMMRRYKTMSDAGVRDLESYNSIVTAEGGTKVPQLIVIIDELADLMMVAAKEVEDSICRIAQMGRASGVHLVIATQRPSADVITGLMKANIPSRIAFSVASAMESRIILDTQGAEKLVGKGDMLFAPIGNGKPLRVQGCFVTDAEVLAVTSYVKEHFVADYDQTVLADIEKKAQQTGKKSAPITAADPEPTMEELEGDELLPQAVDVVLETGQASVSMLQRRLKLGYARAARIVDEMEEKGIVGPFQGSKPRNILVTKEQWEAMKSSGFGQMSMEDMEDTAFPEDLPF